MEAKYYQHQVKEEDFAQFHGKVVHRVYSTFSLGRDAEWCCRQFVLDMKSSKEEGIGTFLEVKHYSPAFEGETVQFTASISYLSPDEKEIHCIFEAKVNERLIAKGKTGQKIFKKDQINTHFESIKKKDK
ncbi:MAG: hypothetical protein LAT68_13015 [Cyclobacteriaceae bacterium]|nr:hypothetical protein [Cyclobacteriaceae bacterium]MCH8517241.1 hypothetical protein [Cyclobacteriaceae bacterium]